MKRFLSLMFVVALGLTMVACDTPRENAVEERTEDAAEAAGVPEDRAEEMGEAAKDGAVTTTMPAATDTSSTVVTTPTETSSTTVTTT